MSAFWDLIPRLVVRLLGTLEDNLPAHLLVFGEES